MKESPFLHHTNIDLPENVKSGMGELEKKEVELILNLIDLLFLGQEESDARFPPS